MAYIPTMWQDQIEGVQPGTPANAANFNHIEQGIVSLEETVNGLTAADVGARPDTWLPTAAEAGALPANAITSGTSGGGTWIDLPGGVRICTGSKTWTGLAITEAVANLYRSPVLYFENFPQTFTASPKCLLSLTVGESNPYWLAGSDYGTTAARPQGFRLLGAKSMTLSTVTVTYLAIGTRA